MWRLFLPLVTLGLTAAPLPRIEITHDDTVITQSCRVSIAAGRVLVDANTNGVIQIGADGITVEFAPGTELRGAPEDAAPDTLRGIGIRLEGHHHVTLKGLRVRGYFNGVVARRADQLLIDGGDISDNYRQHLRSTPQAEDGADWLFPHNNDQEKWRDQYGGAVCVEESREVILRSLRVRWGQNGLILDRVTDSRVYDNDASFLSGWGLALWRSSRNIISRNAFDFCVRGHSEGVYNRGQDSAGILCFEQCNDNVIVENSATHGGDCFFGFAGREALGEFWLEKERDRLRRETGKADVEALLQVPPEVARDFSARGCNRNLLIGNDFSYSPAHGIEMTFSEGNIFARNRLVENAICGVWGGYSSDTLIAENRLEGNGGLAYGLERGGVNMEHASGNQIRNNTFRNNKCAVHLWWDDDGQLLKSPGVVGNDRGVSGNLIAGNSFVVDPQNPFPSGPGAGKLVVLQLRDDGNGQVRDNSYIANTVRLTASNAVEFAVKPGIEPRREGVVPRYAIPKVQVLGRTRPIGARSELRGRSQILMDEWGPWDHAGPLVRLLAGGSGEQRWEVRGVKGLQAELLPGRARLQRVPGAGGSGEILKVTASPGVTPYEVQLRSGGWTKTLRGSLLVAPWTATFFPWTANCDPRTNLPAWRALATGPDAVPAAVGALDFNYGGRGPKHLGISEEVTRRGPGAEHFGMIARTKLPLPAGRWRLATLSDDGVRVKVGGRVLIENWNWHGPTPDEAIYEQTVPGDVEIEVEHFEIDGHAVLRFELSPVR